MDDKDDKAEGSTRGGGGGAGLERAAFSLLREIVDLAADERELHLAGHLAGHDPEVVARVREILDADGDPTEPLAGGLPFPPAALGVDDGGSRPEADGLGRIGPYRLLAALGEGGMGRVYLAEQGEPVERRVALKVIGSRFLDDHTRLRFQAERQALARLSHPHIAQLYEAGSTADGRPYFAMEVIDGPPITVYCDRHRLPVERRLELFVAVCRGVQHAHQRQLLHRDLKPTNVLVAETDGEPVPKVIDFGIAKALDTPLADATLLTGGELLGTPQYMSPEALQPGADSGDLDTRSDVYSLGVLLYELLTGVRPFAEESGRLPSLLRAIAEDDPPRPSTRLAGLDPDTRAQVAAARLREPVALASGLSGDLDWIVMKALEKDRGRRYRSAAELADDVERSLNDEPVLARPPTLGYRMGKLVRRHRLAAALGALTAAALLTTAVASSVALVRVRRAEERARGEVAASRQALGFVVELFEGASPEEARGGEVSALELLEHGVERLGDQDLPPLSRARLLHTLADVHLRLGLYEEARGLAAEALAIREAEQAADHPETIATVDLLGNLERRAGRLDRAAPLLERVVAVYDARADPDPAALADALNSLGNLRWRQGRYDDAERLHRRTLALRREALGPEAQEVAASHNNLGALYWSQGRLAAAEPHFRTAAELLDRRFGADHPRVADALGNLGMLETNRGRYAEGEAIQRRVLAIRERVLGPAHPDTATSVSNLAITLSKAGREEEAEQLYRRALDIRRRALGEEHAETLKVLINLGLHYWRTRRPEQAEPLHRQALAVRERTLGADHPATARARVNLALVLRDLGRLPEARVLLERALEDQRAAPAGGHRDVALTLHHLGVLEAREGRSAEAEALLRESMALREQVGDPEPALLAGTLHELGDLYRRDGRTAEAAEHYRRALELRRTALPPGHEDVLRTEAALASLGAPAAR